MDHAIKKVKNNKMKGQGNKKTEEERQKRKTTLW
jgi:hypothetical protein